MSNRQGAGLHAVLGIEGHHVKPGLLVRFMGLEIGFRRQPELFLLPGRYGFLRKSVRDGSSELYLHENQKFAVFRNQVDLPVAAVEISLQHGIAPLG